MLNESGDWYSDDPLPSFTSGNSYGDPPLILAACPWAATSYTVAIALSAIRRSLRRRSEIRALERAFARAGENPKHQGPGRRRYFVIQSRSRALPGRGEQPIRPPGWGRGAR
jgi:hypothetical protein